MAEHPIDPTDADFVDEVSPVDDKPISAQLAKEVSPPWENNPQDRAPGETPSAGTFSHVGSGGDYVGQAQEHWQEPNWLIQKAQEIYTISTDYMEANITNTWETNLSHFHNQHAPGSSYQNKGWKRSRVFRPKTRSMTKAQEATLATAAFSTQQFTHIQAEDSRIEAQRISAQINQNILQYRLDRRMPWFLTTVGAFQNTKVYGLCISHQYWNYVEDEEFELEMENGEMMFDDDLDPEHLQPLGIKNTVVRKDEMVCDLIAPENFRFDPVCDWRDPINTSPYLIYMMPIYAGEVLERMEKLDSKTGQPLWMEYSLSAISATRRENYDRTRQAREGRERIDPADDQRGNDTDLLWAHMNIVRVDGEDIIFWTMGTELLLTEPMTVHEAYPHLERGERPFTFGYSTVEAHRNYPAGDVEQISGLQSEINAVANQRMDNVKLVLNKRYYVRRGSQVDLDALIRNVPGGGVMMNDPEKDVKTVETRDVTGSSYEETVLMATEADELTGSFSRSSMQNNRQSNQPEGNVNKISDSASQVEDYAIRIFMETWMEPTLRQFLKLIQYYETDEVILSVAAGQSELWQRFGTDQVTDALLSQDLTLKVNIGIGNTDPMRRVERLVFGIGQVIQMPGMEGRIKPGEITDEIFGALGYKDSSRFFLTEEEMQKKAEEEAKDQQPPPEIQMKQMELQIRKEDNQARDRRENNKLAHLQRVAFAELALKRELTLTDLFANLGIKELKIIGDRDIAALRESNKVVEMNVKRATGA